MWLERRNTKTPIISAQHKPTRFEIDLVIFFFKYRFTFQPSFKPRPLPKMSTRSQGALPATLIGLGHDQDNHLCKCVNLQK